MTVIDNDFHPIDSDLSATNDHWGTKYNLWESRPQSSLGGRSPVENNNPELGPSDSELNSRVKQMENQRRKNSK